MSKRIEEFVGKFEWIRKDEVAAYSFRQAFSESDAAYAASIGVVKACAHVLRGRGGTQAAALTFVFPIIVIDSPLIKCSLDDAGNIRCEAAPDGEFLFLGGEASANFGTCIRILTADRLQVFAKQAKDIAGQLRTELKPETDIVVASWNKR